MTGLGAGAGPGTVPQALRPGAPGSGEPLRRYRHPGDVLKLVASAAVVLFALGACAVLGTLLLGSRAAVLGIQTDTVAGRLLVGLAQLVAVLAPLIAVAILVLTRHFRLLASLLAAAVVAAGAWVAVMARFGADPPSEVVANREIQSWIGAATFPAGSLLAGAVAAAVLGAPWLNAAWRRVPWLAVGLVAAAQLIAGVLLPWELVLALSIGWLVGAGFLVAFGAPDRRITAEGITQALAAAGVPVVDLTLAAEPGTGSRPFVATLADGQRLFVKVLGQDQRDADLLYRGYRYARLRGVGDTRPAASLKQAVELQALAAVMAERAGVHVPHIHQIVEAVDGSVLVTMDLVEGRSLERTEPDDLTDERLRALWSEVERLHGARVAHRSLRAPNVMIDASDRPWIVDFSFSEVAATDRQLALDRAELLASLALLVGPDRATSSAAVLGDGPLAAAVPLLQPLALSAGTRRALRGQGDLLTRTREATAQASSAPPSQLPNLQRVRPKTLLMIAAATGAFYLVLPQLAQVSDSWRAFQSIDWAWVPVIVVMSFLTYLASAVSMLGAVSHPLPFGPTLLTQWASSFVNRVSPANIGGMALNIRFFQRCGVDPPTAAAGVGLNSLAGGIMHMSLLVGFFTWSGSELGSAFALPSSSTVLLVLAVVGAVVGVLLATRWGRRNVIRRLTGGLRAAAADLRRVARSPAKLGMLFGGSAATTLAYIGGILAAVTAFGGGPSLAQVGTVYLAGSALASVAPTPGGLGPLEAALVAGLTGVGMESGPAVSAVLTYRLATYWLPILPGWLSFQFLQRRGYL